MSKFSRIIKHNKKSLSIDEKIKFLDKEMEKTGLNEMMTTKGMYSIVQPNPGTPEETATVPNSSNMVVLVLIKVPQVLELKEVLQLFLAHLTYSIVLQMLLYFQVPIMMENKVLVL